MTYYLVAAEPSAAKAIANAVRDLGGQLLNLSCWIVYWSGTADALRRRLALTGPGHLVVCCLDTDWTYR